MRKVLHLINGEFYSGAERVQDLLALRLPEHGWSVGFACLRPGRFPSERKAKDVPLYEFPMRSRFDMAPVNGIVKLVRDEGFDILHTHTPRTALIGRLVSARTGCQMVHHVHSPTSRDSEGRLRNVLNSFIENVSLGRVSKLIAVSSSLRGHLLKCGFPSDLISVVPNGVPVTKSEISWEKPDADWVIGTVALFRPRKGLEVLLAAIASLLQMKISVRLLAVGGFENTSYEMDIKKLAKSLGISDRIEWTGFTGDVNSQFERMNIFVLPSLYGEGLPMVVIEAMAAGLPVVGANVEGIPEVLGKNEFGVSVEPGSASAIHDAIACLIASGTGAKSVAIAGHSRQRAAFSDIAMAKGVAKVYAEIVS